jgi:MerR family transcriptional regulator, copper efflux regulator
MRVKASFGLLMDVTVQVNVHMKSNGGSTIGELVQRFGLAAHVLRHWESMGLLEPARDGIGQRRYGEADAARIAMILMGKEAGLSLGDLRILFTTDNPMDHPAVLRRHIAALDERIAQATAAKRLIEHALSCPIPFERCPHAQEQIAARVPPRGSTSERGRAHGQKVGEQRPEPRPLEAELHTVRTYC